MSVALRGNLRDFGIADVFQLIGQQRKTGVLEFSGEAGERVQLSFDRGLVVTASPVGERAEAPLGDMLVRCGRLTRQQLRGLESESEASAQTVPRRAVSHGWIGKEELQGIEDLLTRETLFHVLQWEAGEFDFRAQAVAHDRRIDSLLGAEQILMDSLRMVDEWHSFSEQVPSDEVVFQHTAGFEDYRRRSPLDPTQLAVAERVFGLVDGRIPVRRIVDLSLLGTFDAVRILADMRRCEVLEPLDADALERLRSVPVTPVPLGRSEIQAWLAGVAPLLLLGGLLWWAASASAPPGPGFDLRTPAHVELHDAYATRRLRHALEAHRFATGAWPDSLEQLAGDLRPAHGLAGPEGASYYYAHRDGRALLLAPAR